MGFFPASMLSFAHRKGRLCLIALCSADSSEHMCAESLDIDNAPEPGADFLQFVPYRLGDLPPHEP